MLVFDFVGYMVHLGLGLFFQRRRIFTLSVFFFFFFKSRVPFFVSMNNFNISLNMVWSIQTGFQYSEIYMGLKQGKNNLKQAKNPQKTVVRSRGWAHRPRPTCHCVQRLAAIHLTRIGRWPSTSTSHCGPASNWHQTSRKGGKKGNVMAGEESWRPVTKGNLAAGMREIWPLIRRLCWRLDGAAGREVEVLGSWPLKCRWQLVGGWEWLSNGRWWVGQLLR